MLPAYIAAIILLVAALLFPAVNSAASEPGRPAPTKQEENYNRLIDESSPYLLQHATNPVNWYPWNEEAIEAAKREDKPIFLSIGYSTCHWCHVMAHESFADNEVAGLLNKDFISIKVDREERPDIDRVYMTVTQALTGSGGWPMTIIMTPDKKPFYAGTYFPKNSRLGRPGLMALLPKIVEVWRNDRNKINDSADRITRHVAGLSDIQPGSNLDRQILDQAQAFFVQSFDPEHGGFGQAPKFPSAHQLSFLLRRYHHSQDQQTLAMVEKTLTQMRLGGIYDQNILHLQQPLPQLVQRIGPLRKSIPSGNSVAVFNLLRLGHMTEGSDNLTKAERIIKAFSAEIAQHPAGYSQLMVALEFALNPNYEVVIVGQPQGKDTQSMLAALRKPFLPQKVVLFRPTDHEAAAEVTGLAPFTLPMAAKNGQATAYVCQEFACKLPTTSIVQMLENLRPK